MYIYVTCVYIDIHICMYVCVHVNVFNSMYISIYAYICPYLPAPVHVYLVVLMYLVHRFHIRVP